jgi:hypothetical protein
MPAPTMTMRGYFMGGEYPRYLSASKSSIATSLDPLIRAALPAKPAVFRSG